MARQPARKRVSLLGLSSVVDQLTALPRSFAFGLLTGLLVPVAAVGGIVGGVYLFTRKVPFVTDIVEQDGERHLVVKLVEPDEARSLFERGKKAAQAFGDEIRLELDSGAPGSGHEYEAGFSE